jgi:hypothetical protein
VARLDGAEWLGSAGGTALVRCVCGARLYRPLRLWARWSFTACGDCGAVILYASLEVVDPRDAEEFIEMVIAREEERELLKEDVERELRRFVRAYDGQPEWLWSPATQKFVRAVRPKLELLGGPIGSADDGRQYGVAQESAYVSEGGEEGPPDDVGEEDDEEEEEGEDEDEADAPESDAA